jgi:hypothetical protein
MKSGNKLEKFCIVRENQSISEFPPISIHYPGKEALQKTKNSLPNILGKPFLLSIHFGRDTTDFYSFGSK